MSSFLGQRFHWLSWLNLGYFTFKSWDFVFGLSHFSNMVSLRSDLTIIQLRWWVYSCKESHSANFVSSLSSDRPPNILLRSPTIALSRSEQMASCTRHSNANLVQRQNQRSRIDFQHSPLLELDRMFNRPWNWKCGVRKLDLWGFWSEHQPHCLRRESKRHEVY